MFTHVETFSFTRVELSLLQDIFTLIFKNVILKIHAVSDCDDMEADIMYNK